VDRFSLLQKKAVAFRDEREWQQFHTPRNLAISLSLEAAEVLEHFQWKTDKELDDFLASPDAEKLHDEMADVFAYLIFLADRLNVDLIACAEKKMVKNTKKYPVEKSKGSSKKYTEL
jgi:NTP pyrophosphatase (non-canonical NTP hydrolase)